MLIIISYLLSGQKYKNIYKGVKNVKKKEEEKYKN